MTKEQVRNALTDAVEALKTAGAPISDDLVLSMTQTFLSIDEAERRESPRIVPAVAAPAFGGSVQ